MNKPIIIDGVVVSVCEWLSYGYVYINCEKEYYCGQEANEDDSCLNRNCLFKNLKKELQRLKAENEKLKNKIFDEGLIREKCKYYKQVCSENAQLIRLDEEVKVWKANAITHEQKEIEYKQALEEIRDILCTNRSFEELLNRNNDKNINKIDKVVKLINEVLKDA